MRSLRLPSRTRAAKKTTRCALDTKNLIPEPSTFAVLIGPSGFGKFTLLNVVVGFVQASKTVVLLGAKMVRIPHSPPLIRIFSRLSSEAGHCLHIGSPIGCALKPQKYFMEPKGQNVPASTPRPRVHSVCQLGVCISFSNIDPEEPIWIWQIATRGIGFGHFDVFGRPKAHRSRRRL